MKVYIANDTSRYHAGSWAAMASLRQKLIAKGHDIICSTLRPHGPDLNAIHECDAIIVNGEGALNNERTSWHKGRASSLLEGLKLAKQLGKKAYLINCVWQKMNPGWRDVLKSLDGLWVREICSQKEMEKTQGVNPQMYLDLSYTYKVDESKGSDKFLGKDVVGTFYPRNMHRFDAFDHTHPMFAGMPRLNLGGEAERLDSVADWSYIVSSLRNANIYITGQHHGVYAAAKARIPFAIFKVNTHKLEGLLKWAGVNIPIAKSRKQLEKAIEWAKTHKDVYEQLFDWMEQQPVWSGI